MSTSAVSNAAARTARLARALELVQHGKVTRLGNLQYLVKSGEDHYVDLAEDPTCDCGDAAWRKGDCKHTTASRLFRINDPALVKTLADSIAGVAQ